MIGEKNAATASRLLAVAGPLASVPALVAMLAWRTHGDVASSLIEGGAGMYVVLAAAGLAACGAGVLLHLGWSRRPAVTLAASPLVLLAPLAGALAQWRAVGDALRVVAQASPFDRAPILSAAFGEATWLGIFAADAAACLLFGIAVALVSAAIGRRSIEPLAAHVLALAGLSASLAALFAFAEASRLDTIRQVAAALAHAHPFDRVMMFELAAEDFAAASNRGLLCGGAALLAVLFGVARARSTPTEAVALTLSALVLAGGGGVFRAACGALRRDVTGLITEIPKPNLLPVDGLCTDHIPHVRLSGRALAEDTSEVSLDDLGHLAKPFPTRSGNAGPPGEKWLELSLAPDANGAALQALLARAREEGVSHVELVGSFPRPRPAGGPLSEELASLDEAIRMEPRRVVIELKKNEELTSDDDISGSITDGVLKRSVTPWPAEGCSRLQEESLPKKVLFVRGDSSLGAAELARAAATALAHDTRLGLIIP